jgi:hypothetical protein
VAGREALAQLRDGAEHAHLRNIHATTHSRKVPGIQVQLQDGAKARARTVSACCSSAPGDHAAVTQARSHAVTQSRRVPGIKPITTRQSQKTFQESTQIHPPKVSGKKKETASGIIRQLLPQASCHMGSLLAFACVCLLFRTGDVRAVEAPDRLVPAVGASLPRSAAAVAAATGSAAASAAAATSAASSGAGSGAVAYRAVPVAVHIETHPQPRAPAAAAAAAASR